MDDADPALLRDRDREALSVTVSMAALTIGMLSVMSRVSWVDVSTSRGCTSE